MFQAPIKRWLVLEQGSNPSTDYYIRPRLAATGLPVTYRHLDRELPHHGDLSPGTAVVIVRYLTATWVKALYAHRRELSAVIYFLDDDLLRPEHWTDLPRQYAKKLDTYCRAFIGDIYKLSTEFWFSTETLRNRYAGLNARVIAPCMLAVDAESPRPPRPLGSERDAPTTIFYHGSAAHRDEIAWLRPIVAEVLERCPSVHFEILGNHDVNVQYRDQPRTRVLHPMSWPNYLSHCYSLTGHIGLAPLLKSPFNESRSHIKVFDIARCAAVGVYSAAGPYRNVISHQGNGLLLDNDPEAWIEALCELANQPKKLHALRDAASRFRAMPYAQDTNLAAHFRDGAAARAG